MNVVLIHSAQLIKDIVILYKVLWLRLSSVVAILVIISFGPYGGGGKMVTR